MTFSTGRLALAAAAVAASFVSGSASADASKAQCVTSNANAQHLRQDGKFDAAREQLRLCSDRSCPAMVRSDCVKRLDELETAQPTIVFDVKDREGHDLSAVSVTIDARPFADKLEGSPLSLEPGEHTFVFTVQGQEPVTENVVIKEGEKARHEKVVIGAAAPPVVTEPAVVQPASKGLSTQKLAGLVTGGVGVAGVIVGGVFAGLTASAISAQKSDCASASNCTNRAGANSEHSTWTGDSTISTIAFVAGGALVAGGAVLFLTGGHGASPAATTGFLVVPSMSPGGGGVWLRGEF